MQTHSSRRWVSLALGATALFDVTGAAIYRVVRAGMPEPAPGPAAGPFQQATMELLAARRDAIVQATAGEVTRSRERPRPRPHPWTPA
jgi:hypothetical protein